MYPVTQDFLDKMKADRRQVLAKVVVDFTDPFMDQSIEISANEQANVSYPQQTADSVQEATHKWASLDGSWALDGTYHLAPSPDKLAQYQFGWWGAQLAGVGGAFTAPYPALTVTHFPRPIHTLKVIGDTARGEYPVDFEIKLYAQDDTLLHTESITGNNLVSWSLPLPSPILDVAKQVLTITRWSHEGRQAKIVEFFTSIRETYQTGDLVSLHLLEEREASQGSLPVGNISANEVTLTLNNESKKFDVDNEQSPLYRLLKPNCRIKTWLGIQAEGDGQNVSRTETTQDDWASGTLSGVQVTENGDLELSVAAAPTFTRPSVAYKSDGTQVAANQPRFEQGRFGKAIMVEEGTTNLVINPFFGGTYSNGLAPNWTLYRTPTVYENTNPTYITYGSKSQRIVASAKDQGISQNFTISNDVSYTAKVRVYIVSGRVRLDCKFGTSWGAVTISPVGYTGWWEVSVGRVSDGTDGRFYVYSYGDAAEFYVDAAQYEAKAYSTSFIDGTRSPEILTIPTAGVLNPQEGTVERCIYLFRSPGVNEQFIFDGGGPVNQNLQVVVRTDGKVEVRYGTGTSTVAITGTTVLAREIWYGIAWKWSSAGVVLLINGTVEASSTTAPNLSFGANAYYGSRADGTLQLDGLIDDDRISSRARSDEEIAAACQSGQPLPVDEWTTYKLNFDGSLAHGEAGYRVSPSLDIFPVGVAASSSISWTATIPPGTDITVETSLDGGVTWQVATNGGAIPGINPGNNLTGKSLLVRQMLTTQDTTQIPQLHDLAVRVNHEEWVPLGTFWSLDWDSPDDTLEATVTARDRMELLRKGTYQTSQVFSNKSLYELAEIVLQDAGLNSSEYIIDTDLQSIIIPYAWFNPVTHREALRRIAEAGLAAVFQNRDGRIQIESFLISGDEPVLEITEDDYFPPLRAPSRQDQVANEIIVDTQPLRPVTTPEEVYRSNEPITIPASSTKTVTAFYNQPPVIEASASLDSPPSGVSIIEVTYYGWGATVKIQNTNATNQQATLVISGKPLTVQNKERAIARDETSITENGVLRYEFPENPLVQTLSQAQAIADTLLASVKDPRRDLEVDWRGNPALLLGDRVTVKGQDYHVIRQEIEWAGALSARLTGRKVI